MISSLYSYAYDQEPDYMVDADVKIQTICEVDNFTDYCDFNFNAIGCFGYDTKQYQVKNVDKEVKRVKKVDNDIEVMRKELEEIKKRAGGLSE